MHGGTKKSGEESPSYKHGAYTRKIYDDYDDDEREAHEDMAETLADGDSGAQREVIAEAASEAWVRYQRSGDQNFLREFRMFAEKFNLAPNSDNIEHRHDGIEAAFMADLRDAADDSDE